MMNYEKMLDRLYASLPQTALKKERFELIQAESFIQGNKTIIKNFSQILKQVRREPNLLLKYFTKEFAAPANIEDNRLIINTKISQMQIRKSFQNFVKNYVLCSVCGKPDTHFEEKQGIRILRCEACGAQTAIKKL